MFRELEIPKFFKTNEPSKVAWMNAAVHLVLIKAEGKLVNVYKHVGNLERILSNQNGLIF